MTTPFSMLPDRRGYSVMELLTVVVLIGVLSSLAVPSFQQYVSRNRTRRALDRVAGDLAHARLLAIRDGRTYRMRASSADRYVLERVSLAGQAEPVKQVALEGEFPGTRFALPGDGLQLEFTSRGFVRNASGEIFIKVANSNARDSIFVSPAGRVYRAY